MVRVERQALPMPIPQPPDSEYGWGRGELEAINDIRNAYFAMNATGYEQYSALALQDDDESPMSLLSRAIVSALSRLPGLTKDDAEWIWEACQDGGEDISYCYTLWRDAYQWESVI
jgi:hypothetical protein